MAFLKAPSIAVLLWRASAAIVAFGVLNGFAQDTTATREPTQLTRDYIPIPADDVPPIPELRAARDALFARWFEYATMPSVNMRHPLTGHGQVTLDKTPGAPPKMTIAGRTFPELPGMGFSDTIVIGDVLNITSYVINEIGIYSEYRVRIQQVLHSMPGYSAITRETTTAWDFPKTLDVVEIGGAVRTPEGTVQRLLVDGYGDQIEKADSTYGS